MVYLKNIAISAVFFMGLVFSHSILAQDIQKENPPSIIVTGNGEATVIPDIGRLQITITHEGRDHDSAMQKTAEDTTKLISNLKQMNIAEKDMRTGAVSMYPVYAPNTNIIANWRAQSTLDVTLRDLSQFGAVTQKLASLQVGQFWGPNLQVEDTRPARNLARANAVEDAQNAANALAKAAGLRIIGIRRIMDEEASHATPMMMSAMAMRGAADMMESAPSMPVMAGEQKITARVTVIYDVIAE